MDEGHGWSRWWSGDTPIYAEGRMRLLSKALTVLLIVGATTSAANDWLYFRSENFELYTDTSAATGRKAMETLEQIRQVFAGVDGRAETSPLPVKVFLFESIREFAQYRSSTAIRGLFLGGPDADFILLHYSGPDTWQVAIHEYVHVVLHRTSVKIPQWLEEGTAEFYSTLRLNGEQLRLGTPIAKHLRQLQSKQWMPADEFAAVTENSPLYFDAQRGTIFYAQSWALVHMLKMSPEYREKMPRYAELLEAAVPYGKAFQEAFGKPLSEAFRDTGRHLRDSSRRIETVAWQPPPEISFEERPLSEDEVEMAKLSLQLQAGLWDVSEDRLRKLARKKGETPEIATARGLVALSRQDSETARREFELAIEKGSRDGTTYFEYAMLLQEAGAGKELVRGYLERTVELNPQYAEAHFRLGMMAAGDGRHAEAIPSLREAARLMPRRSHVWHALALAYDRTGQRVEAERAARRALDVARTQPERNMARAAIQMIEREPASPPVAKRPAVTTPEGWFNRQGDSRAEGQLVAIDCLGNKARLQVQAGGERVALLVVDPGKVVMKNLSGASFEFACGAQHQVPVAVEYIARPDDENGTAGDVTQIELQ